MTAPRSIDWRAIVAGLAVTAGAASCGAAIDVRDRQARNEAAIEKATAVQAERDDKILGKLSDLTAQVAELRADMKAPR